MFHLTILYGIAIGLSLGLTGGGGSILAVPLLVYGLSVAPHEAVSVSLAAVGTTSLAGAVHRLVGGEIETTTGLLLAVSGIAGAPLGTWVGGLLSQTLLLAMFAGLMVVVAVRMWIAASRSPSPAPGIFVAPRAGAARRGPACRREPAGDLPLTSPCFFMLLAIGLVTGVFSGLFGVGGGFVIVPALVLLTGLDVRRAVATSLLVIAVISGAGLASHLYAGRTIAIETAVPFAVGGIIGLEIGTWGGRRISPLRLQKILAIVIVAVAAYVLARNLA